MKYLYRFWTSMTLAVNPLSLRYTFKSRPMPAASASLLWVPSSPPGIKFKNRIQIRSALDWEKCLKYYTFTWILLRDESQFFILYNHFLYLDQFLSLTFCIVCSGVSYVKDIVPWSPKEHVYENPASRSVYSWITERNFKNTWKQRNKGW